MRYVFSFLLFFGASLTPLVAGVDSGLLDLVPAGCRVISSVDVAAAKNSPFGGYVLSRINTQDHGFEELIQETGFDPRRDLQDFVFASPGMSSASSNARFVVLIRGHFDHERIRADALKDSTMDVFQGTEVFLTSDHHQMNALAFVNDSVMVLGDLNSVHEVLAHRGSPSALDPDVQRLVATVGPNNDLWFVSTMPGAALADHLKQQASKNFPVQALDSISQSSGGLQFGDVVRLSFDAVARSPKDAQSLVDVLRFSGSMVQMSRDKNPSAQAFAAAIDQMKLEADGDAVHIALSIPEQTLEHIANGRPRAASVDIKH